MSGKDHMAEATGDATTVCAAFEAGFDAYADGADPCDNPYAPGTAAARWWASGLAWAANNLDWTDPGEDRMAVIKHIKSVASGGY